jgi:hypothetical protein
LIILEPNLETGECSLFHNEEQKYTYDNFRGGSQGFYIGNNLYFIVHEVVYETDGNRTYYHRIIQMNKNLKITFLS